jgi:hypothetical protein
MPLWKFRTLDEAGARERSVPGSPEHLRRLRLAWEFWARARPKEHTRGVFRYRSIEDAQATVDAITGRCATGRQRSG